MIKAYPAANYYAVWDFFMGSNFGSLPHNFMGGAAI